MHTPAPWRIEGTERFYSGDMPNVVMGPIGGDPIAVVCDFNRYDRNAEQEANARLIAAAPELLAACKAAAVLGELGIASTIKVALRVHERGSFDRLMDTLRGAIAKAEGK